MTDVNTETRQNSLFKVDITWYETKNNEEKKYVKTIVQIAKNRERAEEIAKMSIPWSIKEKPEILSNLSIKTQQFKESSNIIEKILYKSPVTECRTYDLETNTITPEGETLIRVAYNYSKILNKITNIELKNKLKNVIESDLINIIDKTNKNYNNGSVMPVDKLIENMLKGLANNFTNEELILSDVSNDDKIKNLEEKINEYNETILIKDNKINEYKTMIDEKSEKILKLEKEIENYKESLKIKEEQLSNKNEIIFDNKILDSYMEKHNNKILDVIQNKIEIIDTTNFENVIETMNTMVEKTTDTENNVVNMAEGINNALESIPKILDTATKNMETYLNNIINEKIKNLNETMKVIEETSKKSESVVLAKSSNIKEELENINAAVFTTAKECEESIETIINTNKSIIEYENIAPRTTIIDRDIYEKESIDNIQNNIMNNIIEKANAVETSGKVINNINNTDNTDNEETIEKTSEKELEKEIKRINNDDNTSISDIENEISNTENNNPIDVKCTDCNTEEEDNKKEPTKVEKETYYISDIDPAKLYAFLINEEVILYTKSNNEQIPIKDYINSKNITIEQPNVLFKILKTATDAKGKKVLNIFLEKVAEIPVEKFKEIDETKSIGK